MKGYFGLTETEKEIMEILWNAEGMLSFGQIMEQVNSVLEKGWKKQTLNTYLSHLQEAGLIEAERSQYRRRYYAAWTREEYIQRWTQKLVRDSYGDSIGNFVAAFTGGKKLSEEDLEKLKQLI